MLGQCLATSKFDTDSGRSIPTMLYLIYLQNHQVHILCSLSLDFIKGYHSKKKV